MFWRLKKRERGSRMDEKSNDTGTLESRELLIEQIKKV
jgi:hypothetical protein